MLHNVTQAHMCFAQDLACFFPHLVQLLQLQRPGLGQVVLSVIFIFLSLRTCASQSATCFVSPLIQEEGCERRPHHPMRGGVFQDPVQQVCDSSSAVK